MKIPTSYIVTVSLLLIGSGCVMQTNTSNNISIPTTPENLPIHIEEKPTPTMNKYSNQELGLSFEYPVSLGEAEEHTIYKSEDLYYVSFSNEPEHIRFSSILSGSQISATDRIMEFPECDTLLEQRNEGGAYYATECSYLDGYDFPVLKLITPKSRFGKGSKTYLIKTKQGIWSLSATDASMYDILDQSIASLKQIP